MRARRMAEYRPLIGKYREHMVGNVDKGQTGPGSRFVSLICHAKPHIHAPALISTRGAS